MGDWGDDRRIGSFYISRDHIRKNPEAVRNALNRLIVVRAEMMWDREGIEYTAIGEPFKLVEPYACAPLYDLSFATDGSFRFAMVGSW